MARELALFTAIQGRVVEEGASRTAPLGALVFLLVGLHVLIPRLFRFGWNRAKKSNVVIKIMDCTGIKVWSFSLKKINFFGKAVNVDLQ